MRFTFWILFLLAGCSSLSQKIERPLLYEVPNGTSKAYLFGTIHANVSADELPSRLLGLTSIKRISWEQSLTSRRLAESYDSDRTRRSQNDS